MPGEAIAAHIVYAIKSYAEEHPGTSAAQITRTLEKTIPEEDMPSDRTVQRYVEEVRKADISEAWNPTASTFDTEATRHLLDVIAIVTFTTGGQVAQLTAAEAKILTPKGRILGYDIYRAEDDDPAVVVEAVKSNKYVDRTVLGGLTYCYYVRAFDENGRASVPSNVDTIEMPLPEMVAAANQEDSHV